MSNEIELGEARCPALPSSGEVFNLECYDRDLACDLARLADDKVTRGRPVPLADVARRGFPTQLRDGIARLASPYL